MRGAVIASRNSRGVPFGPVKKVLTMVALIQKSVFVALLTLSTHVAALTLFSQSPPNPDEARISDFAASFANQQAQRFSLTSNADIAALTVWGHYSSGLPTDDFTVRFFADAGGAP